MNSYLYNHRHFFYVLLTFLSALVLNSWSVPLFDVDEGAFSEATREMVVSGNYLTTWLNGEPRFDKPILIYWFQAAAVHLFGVTEISFRLPSILASLGWIVAVWVFTRRHLDIERATAASMMVAASLGVMLIGRAATADALLNLFLVLTLFDLFEYSNRPAAWLRYRVYFWIALGVLTKGPVAILIPTAVSGIYYLWNRRIADGLKLLFSPIGWLVFIVIALPWYVLEYLDQGQAFIDGFFMRHNVERFATPMEQHAGSLFYYLPVVILLVLPFTGLLWDVLKRLKPAKEITQEVLFARYLWVWFGFVIVFFSLSGTKLPHYVIYGLTPLVILMADSYCSQQRRWLLALPALVLPVLTLILPVLLNRYQQTAKSGFYRQMVSDGLEAYTSSYYLLAGGAVLLLISLPFWAPRLLRVFLVALSVSATISLILIPVIGDIKQVPVKQAAEIASKAGGKLVQWRIHFPSSAVYFGHPVPRRDPKPGEMALTRSDYIDQLPEHADILHNRGGILLFRIRP